MKNNLLVFILLAGGLIFSGCSHNLAPTGRYQDSTVIIDGNVSDWGLPLRFSNPEYSMQYGVTNDNKNVYICIYTKDESFQKRILKAGVNIYFDTKGEKNKKTSLVFPVKKPIDPADNSNGNLIRNSDYKSDIDQLLLQSDYYNTIGFTNMENGQYSVGDKKNKIQVAIRLNEDSSLVYEAAVPLSYIIGTDMTSSYNSKNFSVGIVVNDLSPARNNTNRPRSSYGGGGMHMHGMGMGGNRNYGSGNNTPPKAEENWDTFRLVYKKS